MKRIGFLALSVCMFIAPRVHADASTSATAEALYDEGKKLETKGDFASACPKFAESQKLDPAAGTLLHLANCYEKTNKPASAWVTYLDAASAAHAQNRNDWEKAARSKAAALEPKLPHVTINVASPDPSETVKKDDDLLTPASFGVPIPVDPGTHTITAEAPKKKKFTTTIEVAGAGSKNDVAIPKLEDAPDATPVTPPTTTDPVTPPPPPPPQAEQGSSRKTIGYIVGAVGIVGLGVGGVTGLMAISAESDSKKACPNSGGCTDHNGVDANSRANSLGTVSTISFIAGGVLLAGGAALVLTAPSSPEKKGARVQIVPDASPRTAGLTLVGTF